MIKMVVFDMAGTTVNEDNVVYKTLQRAINDQGFSFTLEQVLAEGAGKEKLQAIKSVLAVYGGSNDEQLADRIFTNFRILLENTYATLEVTEQEYATSLFHSLREKGVLVILNTGYQADTAIGLVKKLGWQQGLDYDQLITASDVVRNRPHPDMILRAMQQFGISNGAEVVKVGDSTIDIEEGQNAGCALSIGITTGAHTKEQLQTASPDYIIHHLKELMPIINS